ncbi:MAG: photosystem reaction center subunit H [Cyanobacteria bacterium J06634_5]
MVNIVRRSQLVGLNAMDCETATRYNTTVQEVWIDSFGRVSYFTTAPHAYTPIEQVAVIGPDAVLTYTYETTQQPDNLFSLYQSPLGNKNLFGWVEDFLFDWETGSIAAYVIEGDIASSVGGRAVVFPEDVEQISADVIVLKEGAENRLKSEAEGLKGFLSEKSQQVQRLVKQMGKRLQSLIDPDDEPEVVRVKIKQVSDGFSTSGRHDQTVLKEATEFVQDRWHDLHQSFNHAGNRMKTAVNNAWQRLAAKA